MSNRPMLLFKCRMPQEVISFQLLFGIIITWAICAIMTKAGYFTDDPGSTSYRARTDVRNDVIRLTPWLYVPYPGKTIE